jgi:hypothetical protein
VAAATLASHRIPQFTSCIRLVALLFQRPPRPFCNRFGLEWRDWPQRLALAASMSLSISFSVRYSRGRPDRTVTVSLVGGASSSWIFCMYSPPMKR